MWPTACTVNPKQAGVLVPWGSASSDHREGKSMELREYLDKNEHIAWYEFRDDKVVVAFKDGSTYMYTGCREGSDCPILARIAVAASSGGDFSRRRRLSAG